MEEGHGQMAHWIMLDMLCGVTTLLVLMTVRLVTLDCLARPISLSVAYREVKDRRHYTASLCCDLVLYPAGLSVAIYQLVWILRQGIPYTGWSVVLEAAFSVSLAHLFYRCALDVLVTRQVRAAQADMLVAILTYVVVLATQEDAVLGLVGLVCQAPMVLVSLNKVQCSLVESAIGQDILVVTRGVVNVVLLVVTPAICLTVAITSQSVLQMSIISIATFCFTVVYFLVTNTVRVLASLSAIYTTCRTTPVAPWRPTPPNEWSLLLHPVTPKQGHKDTRCGHAQPSNIDAKLTIPPLLWPVSSQDGPRSQGLPSLAPV